MANWRKTKTERCGSGRSSRDVRRADVKAAARKLRRAKDKTESVSTGSHRP